jgi:electron transfer flavoprotein alpha subunit
MSTENSVMVYVQQNEGKAAEVSLELICKAHELALKLKTSVSAVLFGENAAGEIPRLASLGADRVYIAEDPRLKYYSSVPYSKLLIKVITEAKPQIVLVGATLEGRDLAPRVASKLNVGLSADCTGLQIGDHTEGGKTYKNILYQIVPAFGGNIIATIISPEQKPQMATVREGVMRLHDPDATRKAETINITADLKDEDFPSAIISRTLEEKTVNLKKAQIIVAGGMGVGSKKNFALIHELAHALGGEVGATRPAVDQGFIGHDHMIGQTGITVRPQLYIACGISGAVQHRTGMDASTRIIAINSDPQAPIFGIAHYGIVGDLTQVIPQLIKSYKMSRN